MSTRITEHEATIQGVRVHYYRTGTGAKKLVLVHGFSDNGLCWTPVARALENDYDIVMPDMRGHGLSQRLRPGDTVDMAADVAGLIRALGWDRPVVVGHSMGAMVTFEVGTRFPDLVRALVLEDPPWFPAGPPPAEPEGEPPIVVWARSLQNETLEGLLAGYKKDHPDWPDELIRAMAESKKQLDQGIIGTLSGRMATADVWRELLPGLTVPTLLIAGNPAKGGIVSPQRLAEVLELNPKVETATFPEAGHLIRFDQAEGFLTRLKAFLLTVA